MEEMTSRDRKKETRAVGNHPGQWLTDAERFRIFERLVADMRDLAQKMDANPDGAHDEWMKREAWLMEYSRQLTSRLRDRLPPRAFRGLQDFLEPMENPETLTADPHCWGVLGAMDAVTTMYGAMVTARIACGRVHQATGHLNAACAGYRAKAYAQFAEVHEACLLLCPEAEPKSFHVTIGTERGFPELFMSYRVLSGVEWE